MAAAGALVLAAFAAVALAAIGVRPAAALPRLEGDSGWPGGVTRAAEAAAPLASGQTAREPMPRLWGARRVSGHEGRGRGYVSFTFDDGPHAATTPLVLAALAAHEVPATFFVCGYQIDGDSTVKRANARVLDAIVAAGHMIGNHTYHHTRLDAATLSFAWDAIARNERLVAPHLGHTTHLFRPPYGRLSRAAEGLLDDLGYTVVRWSIDPGDYRPRTPTEVRDRVLHDLIENDGGVVILHDTKIWTARALPMILDGLERENCGRISRGEEPILPVSLDYFATDRDGLPVPVPPEVQAQAQRTRASLEHRCDVRRTTH